MKPNRDYRSKNLRKDPLLLRNDFTTVGNWDIPLIKRCEVDISDIELIPADHMKEDATPPDTLKTVHFFVEDIKMDKYYNNPEKYIKKIAQYPHTLTPDYSLYSDMPMAVQIFNTFRSRWCGAYWQYYKISVIPTISWSTRKSFDFCFDGIEYGSVVAISTLGCRKEKDRFLDGYFEMKKRINPKQVLCFDKVFPEMGSEVIFVSYPETTRRKK
jgi:hypothetical protein